MSEQLSGEPPKAAWDNIAKTLSVQKRKTIFRKGVYFTGAAFCFMFFTTFISHNNEQEQAGIGISALQPANKNLQIAAFTIQVKNENETLQPEKNMISATDRGQQQKMNYRGQLTGDNRREKTDYRKSITNPHASLITETPNNLSEISINDEIINAAELYFESIPPIMAKQQPLTISVGADRQSPAGVIPIISGPPTTNPDVSNGAGCPPRYLWGPTTCYLGFSTSVFNNWLLNNNTYNSFNSNSFSQVVFSLGTNVGISAGMNFSEYYALQGEMVYKNTMGQRYKVYEEGHMVENEIQLQYSQINLLFKKKKTQIIGENPVSFRMLAGPYFALLHKNETFISKTSQYNPDVFRNYDAGINFGVEYEINLNEEITLATGIRAALGLVNIYQGEYKTSANINATRNLSIGCNIGLHHNF